MEALEEPISKKRNYKFNKNHSDPIQALLNSKNQARYDCQPTMVYTCRY